MSKNILITGANRGIGLALAEQYAAEGNQVYAICRSSSIELSSLENTVVIEEIDVVSNVDLNTLKRKLKDIKIDLLINNAGILSDEELGAIDFERVEKQFQVNAIGPLKITEALQAQLLEGSKVVLITSRMGSMADNGSGGSYGYRMSKAALNAVGVSLANDLKPSGIAVGLLHPGFVQTKLVDNQGDIGPTEAAKRLRERISELNLENTGTFRHSNGEYLPW